MRGFNFNPAFEDDETILKSMVGRTSLLEEILEGVRGFVSKGNPRHTLVLGPRGMGKSSLLKAIRGRIRRDVKLSQRTRTVLFPEEQYGITTAGEFWKAVVGHLDPKAPKLSPERREPASWVDLLKELVGTKRLLLLIDNIDLLFGQMESDQEIASLREVLSTPSFASAVATSAAPFPAITDHNRPMFDFFDVKHLEELSLDQVQDLVTKRLQAEKLQIPAVRILRPKIAALREMAGGAPRTINILIDAFKDQLAQSSDLLKSLDVLEHIVDDYTPYFKARIEALPPQQLKIFETLCVHDEAMSPQDIARAIDVEDKQASVGTQLRRMLDSGYVRVVSSGRTIHTYYDVAEPLMLLWRRCRLLPNERKRLEEMLAFLEGLYTESEFLKEIEKKATELYRSNLSGHVAPRNLVDLLSIVSGSFDPSERARMKVNAALQYMKQGDPDAAWNELDKFTEKRLSALTPEERCIWHQLRAWILLGRRKTTPALKELAFADTEYKGDREAETLVCRAAAYSLQLKPDEMLQELARASDTILARSPFLLKIKGMLLSLWGKSAEAEPLLRRALEKLRDQESRLWLAKSLLNLERVDETLALLDMIPAASPLAADVELLRAQAFLRKKDVVLALSTIDRALELGGTRVDILLVKSEVLQTTGQLKPAFETLLQADEVAVQTRNELAQSTVLLYLWQCYALWSSRWGSAPIGKEDRELLPKLMAVFRRNPENFLTLVQHLVSQQLGVPQVGSMEREMLQLMQEAIDRSANRKEANEDDAVRLLGLIIGICARNRQFEVLRTFLALTDEPNGSEPDFLRLAFKAAASFLESGDRAELEKLGGFARQAADEMIALASTPKAQDEVADIGSKRVNAGPQP